MYKRQLYILGSDSLGRDVLSRIIYGTTISLLVGIAGAAISLVIGCVFGLCAGDVYKRQVFARLESYFANYDMTNIN